MKPRITIYAFNDTTYATQLYSYNAFSDSGSSAKPISLHFEGVASGSGSFSIEIEDSDGTLDPEMFIRGNRVFIECSKDGSVWQPAFKGLVRSCERYMAGAKVSNYTISGYSYLVRLNERIINVIKQSALSGPDYNRTDSTMFTDNLINEILTNDADYVYSIDDTALHSLFKTTNITSSPIDTWIPRLDAQLVPISDAINSILEFSGALVTLDPGTDQLVLFDPQQSTTGINIFLVTDQPNLIADNAAYTMYPVEPYTYSISYDYPESGSRLIGSIGKGGECPETVIPGANVPIDQWETGLEDALWVSSPGNRWVGCPIPATDSPIIKVRVGMCSVGQPTGPNVDLLRAQFGYIHYTSSTQSVNQPPPSPPLSVTTYYWTAVTDWATAFDLYVNGVVGRPRPFAASGVRTANYIMETAPTFTQSLAAFPAGETLFIRMTGYNTNVQDANNQLRIGRKYPFNGVVGTWNTATGAVITYNSEPASGSNIDALYKVDLTVGSSDTTLPACGGLPALVDADPVFSVAQDKNASNRIGTVERVLSGIPTHIRTAQTMNEYMFAKLFVASKPRFTFDFPAVTIPTQIPKAGDIVTHVCKKANVGTKQAPIQSGIILSVDYDFRQDDEGIINLTKMGLSTTGIRRGYY